MAKRGRPKKEEAPQPDEKIVKVSQENYRDYSVLSSNGKEISILLYNPIK